MTCKSCGVIYYGMHNCHIAAPVSDRCSRCGGYGSWPRYTRAAVSVVICPMCQLDINLEWFIKKSETDNLKTS